MPDLIPNSDFFRSAEGEPDILIHIAEHDGKVPPHTHEFIEIVYVADGFTMHSSVGRVNMLVTGDLFFVRPGEEHSYINAYRTRLYNLIFTPSVLGDEFSVLATLPGLSSMLCADTECPDGDSRNSGARLIHVGMDERHSLESSLERIISERAKRRVGWESLTRAYLIQFLIRYSRMYEAMLHSRTQSANDYYGYIYRILGYVNENYARQITQTELAEITGLSPDYMSRKFKQALNMSPTEYIRRFRIARAMELLDTTELSIAEIASATGFSDLSLFSRVFKQSVGVPPASYRKMKTEG